MTNKVCIDGIWYVLYKETKEATVTNSDDEKEKYQGEIVIPEVVVCEDEKYSVMCIGWWAFRDCIGLTSITIPESVTIIGLGAFGGCSGLTSITIPESVKSINGCAFSSCSALTFIVVAENNVAYDSRNDCNAIIETNSNTLLAGCSTTIIPESVTSIKGGLLMVAMALHQLPYRKE